MYIMKKRDKMKQNRLQKITAKRAQYEKARKIARKNAVHEKRTIAGDK